RERWKSVKLTLYCVQPCVSGRERIGRREANKEDFVCKMVKYKKSISEEEQGVRSCRLVGFACAALGFEFVAKVPDISTTEVEWEISCKTGLRSKFGAKEREDAIVPFWGPHRLSATYRKVVARLVICRAGARAHVREP